MSNPEQEWSPILLYKGGNTHQNGIGFIVNKNIAGNVMSFKDTSDRVAQLTIKINSKYHLNIIQTCLPTSSHTNEEVDTVYEEIDNLVNNNKAYYNIVMGDFNAKIGQGNASELGTGPYGLGTVHPCAFSRSRSKWASPPAGRTEKL